MQLPLDYMLKMSLCLAVAGIFYFLVLRRLTHYTWNRWFLLVCTAVSFVIPIINLNSYAKAEKLNNVFFVSKIPAITTIMPAADAASNGFKQNSQFILGLFFITVVLILLCRLAIQFFSLKKITAGAQLVKNGDILLYHIPANIAPFSFGRSIYINHTTYSPAELEEVISHETVHVTQKHTFDVMLAELVCIVNWYNPFAWLLKAAIKQNLEFIADDAVIKRTANRKNYQYLLLKVTGNLPLAITNNLNFTSLKNRIAMMNKAKTSRLHLLKFIFVLPLACLLLLAFRQAYNNTEANNSHSAQATGDTFILGTLTYAINDTGAENLVKKDAANSLLQPGNVLSLSSIQNEKFRLAGLLQKNGYDTSGSHTIYFTVDTFSTNKSFAIQVNINVKQAQGIIAPKTNNKQDKNGAFVNEADGDKRSASIGMTNGDGIAHQVQYQKQQEPGKSAASLNIQHAK